MRPEKHLEVLWWDGSLIGHLVNRGSIYFVYDESWLKRGLNLSPLSLPATTVAFNGAKAAGGLPGLISDCLPDSWGRKVAAREFARARWGEPTPIALLAWRGNTGIGPLQFRPARIADAKPPDRLESITAAALARGAAVIERGQPDEILPQLARGGTAGGARPKALVLEHPDGSLSVGQPTADTRPAIIKFDMESAPGASQCEHAYLAMAAAAGINTVRARLLRETGNSDAQHLLVYRFDLPDAGPAGKRIHCHSLAGLLHKEADSLDYTDFFRTAVRLGLAPSELREITRRMVFNVLAANADDHGKNHAFQLDETTGRWALTPAFDLTYESAMLERGMSVAGEVWPSLATMGELCGQVGIKPDEFRHLLGPVQDAVSQWREFARVSGVPAAQVQAIAERLARIREVAEAPSKN